MVDQAPSSTCEAVDSIYTSPVFCIYAGSAKQQFFVHAKLLAKSATLRKIVEGGWKESNDRIVNLEEWDSPTVQRLLEWLYTGQYIVTTEVEVDWTNFSTRDLNAPTTHADAQINTDLVTVYAVAQYLQLDNLNHQALDNIKADLSSIQVLEDRPILLINIVNLIRYTYSSTDSLVNSKEPLRDLVSTFATDWFEALEGSQFEALIAEGGDFVVDLMSGVRKRVQDLPKQSKKYRKRPFKSRVFRILVGPNEEAFSAHEDFLCKSEVLRMIVHGGGKEQEKGKLMWPYWTVGGAETLLEWLYTSDYKCPYPVEASKSEHGSDDKDGEALSRPGRGNETHSREDEIPIDKPPTGFWDVPDVQDEIVVAETPNVFLLDEPDVLGSSPASKKTPAIDAATALRDLSCSRRRPAGKLSQAEEFEKWTGHQLWRPDQLDYEATLQTHAELYQMGDFYKLDELKNMAWERLKSVLISIGTPVAGSRVVANLVTLIHFAYKITSDTGNEKEPLRKLLTTFVALHFTRFKAEVHEMIMSPVESNREFASDLVTQVMQQMEKSRGEGGKLMQIQDEYAWGSLKSKKSGKARR
ncbi:MAG: hypothetical protein Q9182_002544 [Xanthomendoza sp. 2 TL-2023]